MSFRMPSGINHWMEIYLKAPNGGCYNLSPIWFPINRALFERGRVYTFFIAYRTCALCSECLVYHLFSLVFVFSGQ